MGDDAFEFDIAGAEQPSPWRVEQPEPTTLIAVWPHAEQPTREDVLESLGSAAEHDIDILGEAEREDESIAWNIVVALEPDEPPIVLWSEPLYQDAASELQGLLPEGASWVIGLQTMLDLDDPLSDFSRLVRLVLAAAGSSPAVLDVATERWYPRNQAVEFFANPEVEAPAEVLWTTHIVTSGENAQTGGTWIHTHGLGRCGLPELEMLDVPERLAPVGARLLSAIAATSLEVTLPPPGTPFSVGHHMEVAALPWQEAAALLGDNVPGSMADRHATSSHDDGAHTGVRAVVCAPEQKGVFRKAWVWPEEALRRLERDDAVLFQSIRATSRQTALAQATWPELAKAFDTAAAATIETTFTVKAAFFDEEDTSSQRREHLWFRILEIKEDRIKGELLNEPVFAGLHKGEVVQLDRSEISDWGVAAGGKWYEPGNARALVESLDVV